MMVAPVLGAPVSRRPVRSGWKPRYPGEFPTLGWGVLDWTFAFLPSPADERLPFRFTDEQARRVLHIYRLDPVSGKRLCRRCHEEEAKGWGKALALDTPIPTPGGWTTMGALRVGDAVFDERGVVCKVVAATPAWLAEDCWRVTFSDGAEIVASGDHLWTVEELTRSYRSLTVDTRYLAARVTTRADEAHNFRIPMQRPLELPEIDLPLDPYVLGVWLGDGERQAARIASVDLPIIEEVRGAGFDVAAVSGSARWSVRKLAAPLRAAEVFARKHIPDRYLRASRMQRLGLLQGLMDTDGFISLDTSQCEYVTTLPALAAGVAELLASLGIKATVKRSNAVLYGRIIGPKWRLRFTVHDDQPVFRLARKLARLRRVSTTRNLHATRQIVGVERVASVPTRCITIDAPSGLFLAGAQMVPTHNSPEAGNIAIAEFCGPVQFDGWDADGRPVGKPWGSRGTSQPWIQIAAVSEAQTENTWHALYWSLTANEHKAADELRIDVGRTLLRRFDMESALMERVTASAGTREGQPITHAVLDEPQLWTPSNDGDALARTILRNLTKTGGWAHFTGNAPVLGVGSVAETFGEPEAGVLHFATRPSEKPSADWSIERKIFAIAEVYHGVPWIDQDRVLADTLSAAIPWTEKLRFTFNTRDEGDAEDAWMASDLWADCVGDVVMQRELRTAAVVRIAPDHRSAFVAVAQDQGDKIALRLRSFPDRELALGDYLPINEVEDYLRSLRRRYPAKVQKVERTSTGRERNVMRPGPEIAYDGAFFEGSAQRLDREGLVLASEPSTPQRVTPASETLMQRVLAGTLVHDGDPILARQMRLVVGRAVPAGHSIGSSGDPIPAALAAMLAVHRAANPPAEPDRSIKRGTPR